MKESKLDIAWAGICQVARAYGARNVANLREYYRTEKLSDLQRVAVRLLATVLLRKLLNGAPIEFVAGPGAPGAAAMGPRPAKPLNVRIGFVADVDQRLAAVRETLLPEGETRALERAEAAIHPVFGLDELSDEDWTLARGLAVLLLDICIVEQAVRESGNQAGGEPAEPTP